MALSRQLDRKLNKCRIVFIHLMTTFPFMFLLREARIYVRYGA